MSDPRDTVLAGILDTPTVWMQMDAPGVPVSSPLTAPQLSRDEHPVQPLATRLYRAFESGAFSVRYQPCLDARTRLVCGGEALLRWNDPQEEASSPDLFVPVLERTGLIVDVGEWVLRKACREVRDLQAGGEPARVSVNLAPRQFSRPDLVDRIAVILSQTGLPAHRLELEITESMLEDVERASRTLHELRELGVPVLIDDFGVGYSSLGHLKRLPVAGLKLDRSFIAGMLSSRPDRLITESVIRLAHDLDLEVVAEGVEDREHEAWLRRHGVSRLQGFLYSPAVDVDEFAAMLDQQPFRRAPRAARRRRAGDQPVRRWTA